MGYGMDCGMVLNLEWIVGLHHCECMTPVSVRVHVTHYISLNSSSHLLNIMDYD